MNKIATASIASVVAAAAAFIAPWEGVKYTSYQDVAGVWTICYGHIKNAKPNMTATKQQCEDWFKQDLQDHMPYVDRNVTVDLTDKQRVALSSFVFNLGGTNFRNSTMLRLINQGKFCAAGNEFPKWNRAGGKVYRGLTNRRLDEKGLFLEGYTCP